MHSGSSCAARRETVRLAVRSVLLCRHLLSALPPPLLLGHDPPPPLLLQPSLHKFVLRGPITGRQPPERPMICITRFTPFEQEGDTAMGSWEHGCRGVREGREGPCNETGCTSKIRARLCQVLLTAEREPTIGCIPGQNTPKPGLAREVCR